LRRSSEKAEGAGGVELDVWVVAHRTDDRLQMTDDS
jgi:hypothetical protein